MLLGGAVDSAALFVGYTDLDKVAEHTHKLPHESKNIKHESIRFQKCDIIE